MADHLESIKTLARNYRAWSSDNAAEKPDIAKRQLAVAESLDKIIAEVEDARYRLRPLSSEYGDISDLPPEVVAELNLSKVDELEQQLRDIVAAGDGAEVSLDPIIIELWRRHKVTHPRRFVMNKLYRMASKGLIESVKDRKGVYRVPKKSAWGKSPFDSDLDDDVPF